MLNTIRETQAKFEKIDLLLNSDLIKNSDYFAVLNEATQVVYVAMNEEMCDNTEVCHECAKHRDFLRTMIPLLEELAEGAPLSDEYAQRIEEYRVMVKDILGRIASILAAI